MLRFRLAERREWDAVRPAQISAQYRARSRRPMLTLESVKRARCPILYSLAEIFLIALIIPSHPELMLFIRAGWVPAARFKYIL